MDLVAKLLWAGIIISALMAIAGIALIYAYKPPSSDSNQPMNNGELTGVIMLPAGGFLIIVGFILLHKLT